MPVLLAQETNLDFFIEGYYKFNLFGQTLYITTSHICLSIIFVVLVVFAIIANRAIKKADPAKPPKGLVNVIEMLVETLDRTVRDAMGSIHGPKYFNYIGALFVLIFVSNLSGLFGLRPPTADFGVTFPLALITWVMIEYNGIRYQKWGKLKSLFEPIFLFFPMNVVGEVATPVSMSLRLFGNMFSGTIIMALIYGLVRIGSVSLAIVWPAALHLYLDVFAGVIQAYVFIMLTMVFITNQIGDD